MRELALKKKTRKSSDRILALIQCGFRQRFLHADSLQDRWRAYETHITRKRTQAHLPTVAAQKVA
jgi:hypothetical protein